MLIKDQKEKTETHSKKRVFYSEWKKSIANERENLENLENKVKLLKLKNIIFNHSSNYEEEIKEK